MSGRKSSIRRRQAAACTPAESSPATLAQTDPLRNVSGTTPNPGAVPWVTSGSGGWTLFSWYEAHGVGRRDFKIKKLLP